MKEDKINKFISKSLGLWIAVFMCAMLFSCSSELGDEPLIAEERPMELDFQLPDNGPVTRTKTSFKSGDKVYVTATVTCNNEGEETTEIRNSVLLHNGSQFNPESASNRLMWPKGAVKAHFRAYFLPANMSTPPTESTPVTIDLEELSEADLNDDLLMADQNVVNLNGIVMLRFAHTTTKLRFHGLVVDRAAKAELRWEGNPEPVSIHTQLKLTYSPTEGYKHEYISVDGVNSMTVPTISGENSDKTKYTRAVFFLDVVEEEWKKATFTLYQYEENKSEPFKETSLTEKDINLYTMERGRAYYISFYGETSNTNLTEENKWYDNNEKPTEVFKTTEQIEAYFAGDGKNGLDRDLDFDNLLIDGITLSLPLTRGIGLTGTGVFNGNHHTIRNVYVKNGLFNAIPSGVTITNLRLENVKVIGENGDAAGLLAPVNSGTISNVRISGNNSIGTKDVQYVGGLVGENRGTINKVQISGALAVEAYIYNTETTTKSFAVGGLVGYNAGAISDSEINAGGLLKTGGEYTGGDVAVGGMIGHQIKAKTVSECSTFVRVDATQIKAKNSYVGGFCGVNYGKLERNEAAGQVKGALFTKRAATGGFVGYTTSLTEKVNIAVVNGCGATGNVYEPDGSAALDNQSELYTGGFCGFSEIDLKNTYSVGNIVASGTFPVVQKIGALTGLISAEKTIFNSFSITQKGVTDLTFNGEAICKTQNSHYRGKMLSEQGAETSINATDIRLNNAVSTANGYWSWSSSTTVYNGVPYLVKR